MFATNRPSGRKGSANGVIKRMVELSAMLYEQQFAEAVVRTDTTLYRLNWSDPSGVRIPLPNQRSVNADLGIGLTIPTGEKI